MVRHALIAFIVCLPLAARADFLEVRREATLKAEPRADARTVLRLSPGTSLRLAEAGQTNGYYKAQQLQGPEAGFIYRTLVRRHPGDPPRDVGATHRPSEVHSRHCLFGCPSGAPATNDLIVREIYVLSSNDETKFADWVAYVVREENIGTTETRTWRADPLLDSSETLEPDDYAGANAALSTDRGHQVPLASFTATEHWEDTNFLSNITPQKSSLNQGPWNQLESAERDLARERNVSLVFVATGPLYEADEAPLPGADEPHRVPSGYWKVVSTAEGGRIETAAFVFDQETPRSDDFCEHLTTVDEVEERSALDLFTNLEDLGEEQLESGPSELAARLGCSSRR